MRLKWMPIALTAAMSATLLFGGWYAYGHFGIEKPLDRIAEAIPGVETAQTSSAVGTVELTVKLSPDADLADIYKQVQEDGAQTIKGKTLKLVVNEKSNDKLENAWSQALFDVAEAMDHREYSRIKEAMSALEKQYPGLAADTEMDDENVYVHLRDGDAAKFVILPREAEKLGVWPNA